MSGQSDKMMKLRNNVSRPTVSDVYCVVHNDKSCFRQVVGAFNNASLAYT